jgi:hypothetical protein
VSIGNFFLLGMHRLCVRACVHVCVCVCVCAVGGVVGEVQCHTSNHIPRLAVSNQYLWEGVSGGEECGSLALLPKIMCYMRD